MFLCWRDNRTEKGGEIKESAEPVPWMDGLRGGFKRNPKEVE